MTETMTLTHASGLKYQLFMTARIGEAMQDEKTQRAIIEAVQRFNAGDWGKVPDEDKAANDQDMKHRDGHALGRYGTPGGGHLYKSSFLGALVRISIRNDNVSR